jgi:glycosyltransferase involved in cell wall biosynthesis
MVRGLLEGARERGWEATVVLSGVAEGRDWLARLRADFGDAVVLAPEADRSELAGWLGGLLNGGAPAILHTHFTRFDLPALAVARRRPGTAVIWHVHTPLYRGMRARARNAVKYALLGRRADAILVSGAAVADSLARAGVRRSRVEVAGSGVRTDCFPLVSEDERARARADLGLSAQDRPLVHFGWDWFLKDGDLFLAAVRELLGADRAGQPPALTVGAGEAGVQAIQREGLNGAVSVIEPRDDVRTLYAAAEVFVSSSRVEGEPFAVIEALLSGTPVAVTDLPGHRDVCGGLEAARVAERRPEAMAAAIESLLAEPPEARRAAAEATRGQVAARFDLGAWTERMFDRYRRVLDRRGVTA